jgi:hypothetical protein
MYSTIVSTETLQHYPLEIAKKEDFLLQFLNQNSETKTSIQYCDAICYGHGIPAAYV